MRSIPWCVWPSRGQPNESTNEFGPATGHTWSEPSGFGVWPRTSSLAAASSALYFLVSSATRSEIRSSCVDPRLMRELLGRLLASFETEQVVARSTELFLRDLLED